jgi:hypothetical protein
VDGEYIPKTVILTDISKLKQDVNKGGQMKKIILIIISALLLIAIFVHLITDRVNNNRIMSQKVILSLESEENLSDWKITLTPYLKTSIKKWVYDLNIQYTGTKHITNIEYNIGKVVGKATLTEPSKSSFGFTENLVPKNGNEILFNIKWDEQGKNNKGKAIYIIERE